MDDVIHDIHHEFPMCGSKQMSGHLQSRGITVQQHQIDPEGTIARRLHTIQRRHYAVAAPRSLYHVDGNHNNYF